MKIFETLAKKNGFHAEAYWLKSGAGLMIIFTAKGKIHRFEMFNRPSEAVQMAQIWRSPIYVSEDLWDKKVFNHISMTREIILP